MSATFAPTQPSSPASGSASSSGHSRGSTSMRQAAISAVTNYAANSPPIIFADVPAQEYYAANVFTKSVMKDR